MANTKLYDGSGDARSTEIHAGIKRSMGFVPEAYRAMGRSGKFLDAVLSMDKAAGSNLDEKTRQLITIAVSAANGCGYCLHAHRALALKAGCTEEDISGAVEIAAMMSMYNTFNKALDFNHDITPEALGIVIQA